MKEFVNDFFSLFILYILIFTF